MARPLPKKGFYVWNVEKWIAAEKLSKEAADNVRAGFKEDGNDVVYVSGTTKGNFYRNVVEHGPDWNKLTWTCVPSVKDAGQYYDFHEDNPTEKQLP